MIFGIIKGEKEAKQVAATQDEQVQTAAATPVITCTVADDAAAEWCTTGS